MAGEDVPEVRVGPQQLAERKGLRAREAAEARIAVERVRILVVQPVAQRQVLVGELVDVDGRVVRTPERDVGALAAHVTDLEREVVPDVPLEVERPLVDVGRGAELLVEVHVLADVLEAALAVPDRGLDAVRERVRGGRGGRRDAVHTGRKGGDVGVAVGPEVAGSGAARNGVGRPEHRVPAADHRLGIHRVGETDPGPQLDSGRIPLVRRVAVNAGIHEAAPQRKAGERAFKARVEPDLHREGVRPVPADRKAVVVLLEAGLVLHPEAEVQYQVLAGPPVVLDETAEVVNVNVGGLGDRRIAATRDPQQQVGHRAAGAAVRGGRARALGETLREAHRESVPERGGVEAHPPVLTAVLQGVVAKELGVRPADFA